MFFQRENIKTLEGLGLNGTQAKICLTLAIKSTATIREISEASGVARPDTYRAILELENKGLVEKTVSTPTKYSLLSLPDVLSLLIGQREIESLELQERSVNLLKEYQKKIKEKAAVDSQFILIQGEKVFSNRLEKLFEKSQKSICLIMPQKEFAQLLARHGEMLEEVLQKQVTLRIATEKRRNKRLTKLMLGIQKKSHLEIRYMQILPAFYLATFDEKEMLVSTNLQMAKDKVNAVYSNNAGLVELAQGYFNDAWSSGIEPSDLDFRRTKLQFDHMFTNMTSAFAYCKIIFTDENKPVDFVYLHINDAFERIVGLKRKQVIGKRVSKAIPGFEKENLELFEMFGRVCHTQKGEECEIFLKPLNRWHHMSVYSPKKGYIAVLFEDITERKEAELELKQRYDLLESLGENIDAGLAIIDKNYRIVWANKMLKNVAARPGELCYQTLAQAQAVCPDCGVTKIFNQNVPIDIHEYKKVDSKGNTHWVELRVTPLKDENGNVTAALELAVSITERKEAEKALFEKQLELNRILDSSPTIIFYKDIEGKIILANKSFAESLKKSKEELINKTVFDLYSAEISQAMTNDDIAVLKSKQPKLDIIEPYESPNGLRWIRTNKIPTFDENGAVNGLIGFSDDITKYNETENKIRQKKRIRRAA